MRLSTFATTFAIGASLLVGCARQDHVSASAPAITAGQVRNIQITPTFVDGGLTLSARGTISNLGRGNVVVQMNAVGRPAASCTSEGKKEPINSVPEMALTASQTIPANAVQDGSISFNLTTAAPVTTLEEAADCENAEEWKEQIDGIALESAVFVVEQDGAVVGTIACTFGTPTVDGAVPSGNVSCSTR
jgi:hypothetical protein